jgi:heat shock protein HslJ
MTEEEQSLLNAEEEASQAETPQEVGDQEAWEAQEDMAVDVEADAAAGEQDGRRRRGWTIGLSVAAAILALCTIVACISAAIAVFSGGDEEPTTPPVAAIPTKAPVPTAVPGQAWIVITEPDQGQVVDIGQPVKVQGKGGVLTEGNVVVEALDWQGNVLDQQAATLQGPDVGTGGEGTWSVELNIQAEPGTAGTIRAYHPSPLDGSVVAEDGVEVSLGRTEAKTPYIKIEEPAQGALLDISRPVTVRGSGGALAEGNVVVEALDAGGSVLVQQPVVLQGPDVGTGGEGTWSVALNIDAEPGTAGRIRAYHPSPLDGSIVAEDSVEVSLGQTPAVEAYIQIDAPQQGDAIEVTNVIRVSGTGAGLPEGNLVVVAVDDSGNVLDEQPATLQGSDVGTGGEGTWSVDLAVPATGQVPGYIAAFAASPKQRDLIASDHVEVVFYGEYTLEGVTWLLDKTLTGSEITAEFTPATGSEDSMVEGSAGCNTYRGTYVILTRAVGRNRFEIGPLATTRMACDQPLMEQESLFLAAMEAATDYRIEGFTLTIVYPGGELLFYDKNGPRPRR